MILCVGFSSFSSINLCTPNTPYINVYIKATNTQKREIALFPCTSDNLSQITTINIYTDYRKICIDFFVIWQYHKYYFYVIK